MSRFVFTFIYILDFNESQFEILGKHGLLLDWDKKENIVDTTSNVIAHINILEFQRILSKFIDFWVDSNGLVPFSEFLDTEEYAFSLKLYDICVESGRIVVYFMYTFFEFGHRY